jgi:hypothetical protein
MDKAAAQAERSLCFMKAEAFASVDAMDSSCDTVNLLYLLILTTVLHT